MAINKYEADPGYLTLRQATEKILQHLGKENCETDFSHYYRVFLGLAKDNKISYKKYGRMYWLSEIEVENYISEKFPNIQPKPPVIKDGVIDQLKSSIELLEKVDTPAEKILNVIKDQLGI